MKDNKIKNLISEAIKRISIKESDKPLKENWVPKNKEHLNSNKENLFEELKNRWLPKPKKDK